MEPPSQHNPRLRQLFDQALERSESQRLAFLDAAGGGDAGLFQAVARLLVAHSAAGSFLSGDEVRPGTIGRYEVTGELGRGSMGIVYEAKDPLIGRTIALKTIRVIGPVRSDEARFLQQQLFKEATAAGQLSHPNIVTIHDVGMEGEMAYIAMERVEGTSLHEAVAHSGRLGPSRVIEILHQCAQALDYAHQKGIVHRDIKPANIMIQQDGQVKIADFGIAKNTLAPQQTGFGVAMGTPSYMSPEQIRMEPLDGRSDQFSLAVVAYELLTGTKPFQGDSVVTLFSAIRDGLRPSAHAVDPQLDVAVDGVLQRALARLPAHRFATCVEFVSALEPACEIRNVSPGVGEPRRPRVAAAVCLIALAVLAGGAAYWRFYASAVRQTTPAISKEKLSAKTPLPAILLFSANPGSPSSGKRAALRWDVRDATEAFIDPSVGSVAPSGSVEVTPSTPTTYRLTASGPGGTVTASASVDVFDKSKPSAMSTPPRILLFQARPPVVKKGGKFELKWLVEGASDLSIEGVGGVTGDHFDTVATATTTYTLTARGKSGTVTQQATVTVENAPVAEAPKQGTPLASPDPVKLYGEAVALRNSGQAEQAAPLFRQAAELGEVRAMLELGTTLRVARDFNQAFTWFRKAAEAGNVSAMVFLGAMCAQGSGTPKDEAQAAQWFRKAADSGNSVAMDGLGQMYSSGRGVPKDLPEAVRWYRKAADHGNGVGMYHVASAYENGMGVSRDMNEAVRLYRMAAATGDGAATARLRLLEAPTNPPGETAPPHPPAFTPTTPQPGTAAFPSAGAITVPGNQGWTNTGLTLSSGDTVTIHAGGSILVNENGHLVAMSPDGLTAGNCVTAPSVYGRVSAFPAPKFPCWSLIGRIGSTGGIFKVGSRSAFQSRSTGILLLGVNDSDVAGNSGAWTIMATSVKGSGLIPKPTLDPISLTSIEPSMISEKGTHKYTLKGSGLTKETRVTVSPPAWAGSKSKLPDFRPADVSPDGTRMTVYVYVGNQPGLKTIRITAFTPTSATAVLDVPIRR